MMTTTATASAVIIRKKDFVIAPATIEDIFDCEDAIETATIRFFTLEIDGLIKFNLC